MKRRSVSEWARLGVTLASWTAGVAILQSTLGADLARSLHEGNERIELRMQERHAPAPASVQPSRRDEESIEPWELVSV